MIAGTVVTGDAPKRFLIRGIGPHLAQFGLSGVLPDPVLNVYDSSGKVIASNTGWGTTNTAEIAEASRVAGAFELPKQSRDAALVLSLNPGAYTFMVSSESNRTGLALVEAYDLSALNSVTSRAVNISTRGRVGTGDKLLIAGFVIQGPSARTLLIRGVGPTMGTLFNLPGVLGDPKITVFREDGTPIASNDDWDTTSTYFGREVTADHIRAAAASTGAFPLADGTKDAALLLSLAPGNYTVHVTGVENTTGLALVEAYELPSN